MRLDIAVSEIRYLSYRSVKRGDVDALKRSRELSLQLIDRINASSLDRDDKSERLMPARQALANSCLTLMENLDPPEDSKGKELGNEAFDLYKEIREQLETDYEAQAREYRNHKGVIDAKRDCVIAQFRIGVWQMNMSQVTPQKFLHTHFLST